MVVAGSGEVLRTTETGNATSAKCRSTSTLKAPNECKFSDVRVLVCWSVSLPVRPSRRRARCLLFACLSSSAACLRTVGALAPESVPPLSLLHLAILPALHL